MFRLTVDRHWLKVALCAFLGEGVRAFLLATTLVLIDRAWNHGPAVWPLVFFVVCWWLPYVLDLKCRGLANTWYQNLYEHLVEDYAKPGRHAVSDWFADDRRDRDVPFMASEAHQIAAQSIEWFQKLVSRASLVIVHVVLASILLAPTFASAYAASFLLGLALSRWFTVRNRRNEGEEQNAQAALSMRLLGSWDNIVLGNAFNRENWENRVKEELGALRAVHSRILGSERLRLSLVFLVVILPVAAQLVRHFGLLDTFAGERRPLALITFAAVLPHFGYVLQRFPKLFDAVHALPRIREQLAKIEEALGGARRPGTQGARPDPDRDDEDDSDSVPHVEWSNLAFLSNGMVERLRDVDALTKLTHQFRPGRYMILGPAGSGKTTLLLLLKGHQLGRCYYFPGQNTLVFDKATDAIYNPVEKLIACLNQIRANTEGGIILLDDWDVYLDAWSAEQVSQVIDDIAQIRCVIETKRVNLSEI